MRGVRFDVMKPADPSDVVTSKVGTVILIGPQIPMRIEPEFGHVVLYLRIMNWPTGHWYAQPDNPEPREGYDLFGPKFGGNFIYNGDLPELFPHPIPVYDRYEFRKEIR